MAGTLYLVATPIGNLEDISARALRVLSEVDLIACEDTRHTKKLLMHYGLTTRCISYHEHNEQARARELCAKLKEGSSIALVSDAGSPGISDPGYDLVQQAIAAEITVSAIPGATALVAALTSSGLPTDRFLFFGFLSARGGERRAQLESLRNTDATLIFHEAPHRLQASLLDMLEVLGNRRCAVARELTKLHEEITRGPLSDVNEQFADRVVKGEIVIVVDRQLFDSDKTIVHDLAALVAELEQQGIDTKAALKIVARQTGLPKSEVYRRVQAKRDIH